MRVINHASGFFRITLPIFLLLCICRSTEEKLPYRNTSLPIEQRVDDLVSRMSLEEKISQMGHTAPAIERLGVPAYNWWNEALHGVARAGIATVFPQAIGLGATWNTGLISRMAAVISDEGRAKHHEFVRRGEREIYQGLTFWSPNINIFRDPRWGRGMETYGEDPYLTARLGVEFVKGLQGDDPKYLKTVATPKHYAVHSGPEPDRHSFNAVVSERDLRETYLPAFRACVVEGGAWSVMGAYNRTLGEACCASPRLLIDILRKEWGFSGYVVSDCWAIRDIYDGHELVETPAQAAAASVKAGCDLNCGDCFQEALREAARAGLISEEDIDVAVKRLFTARFRLGMFDPPEMVPYARIPYEVNDCPEHRELALRVARESLVLLKNDNGLLPLRKDLKAVAVIGPNADDLDVLLGNYNGTPSRYVTVLEGIRQKVSPQTKVFYATGCDLAEGFVKLETVPETALLPPADEPQGEGLKAEIFDTPDLGGEPIETLRHRKLEFPHGRWISLLGRSRDQEYSIRWSGRLKAPVSGTYVMGVFCDPWVRLSIDNKPVLQKQDRRVRTATGEVKLEAGKEYDLKVETLKNYDKTVLTLKWKLPPAGSVEEAVAGSEAVILCLGLSPQVEGEEMDVDIEGFLGGDRTSLGLPSTQEKLLEKVASFGKPVAVVLLNGSALAVNRADRLAGAILEAWYPGEEGGTAVAEALFGDYNPGGRLPVTFYKSAEQLPPFEDYNMEGRTYRYFRGSPLYPFGHGLSYTGFAYNNLEIEPRTVEPGQPVAVSVEVRNAGLRSGDEVVQLYLTDLEADVPVPTRSLQGFTRVHLGPGETRRVSFTLTARQMSLIDESGARVVEPGEFEVTLGGKQPGFSGTADAATTQTVSGKFTVEGEVTEVE